MPTKPSSAEDEYFAREDALKKRKLHLDQVKALARKEREELQKLHHMRCPKCGMPLTEVSFRGVAIDRCFSCNGTFLDEGELEKLAGKVEEGSVMRAVLNIFKAK